MVVYRARMTHKYNEGSVETQVLCQCCFTRQTALRLMKWKSFFSFGFLELFCPELITVWTVHKTIDNNAITTTHIILYNNTTAQHCCKKMAFFSQDKNQSTKSVDPDNYLVSIATREAGNGTVWGLCLQEDQLFAPVKEDRWEKHESVVVVGVLLIFWPKNMGHTRRLGCP